MKRPLSLLLALLAMAGVTALALQRDVTPPQTWYQKADLGSTGLAVVLEMGFKDVAPKDWSGQAIFQGAKVAKREGYRFRKGDELTGDNTWTASSHRPLRGGIGKPGALIMEPLATVGVVFHLQDLDKNAAVSIQVKELPETKVPLKELLAGAPYKLWEGQANLRLVSFAQPLQTGPTEDDYPAATYGPDGTLYVAYNSYRLRDESRRIEPPMLPKQPQDFKTYYHPEAADQVFLRTNKKGKWSEPIAITGEREDVMRTAVAVDGRGQAWVAYSTQRQGNFDIFARSLAPSGQLGAEVRLTNAAGPDLTPVMCTAKDGTVWLAWQAWDDRGLARIGVLSCANGEWSNVRFFQGPAGIGNCWHPALAAGPDGEVALAFDGYDLGDYDIFLVPLHEREPAVRAVVSTPKFEARPSLVYDPKGTLWLAHEEGPEKWGKDYGAQDSEDGSPLFNQREVKLVMFGKNLQPYNTLAKLPESRYQPPRLPFDGFTSNKFEKTTRYAYPQVGVDKDGHVWVTYRQNFGTRYTTHPGPYWLTFARLFEGLAWSEPIELHHSDGMLDHRAPLLPHPAGGLLVVHNTDCRHNTPDAVDNQIYFSRVNLDHDPKPSFLSSYAVAYQPEKREPSKATAAERAVDRRFKTHRLEVGGKKLQYLRGEFHRHTEVSWDGASDGSLEDMFRYAIDAAAMEWIGNGDHDNGAGREYPWWLTQKLSDAYKTTSHTPMFTYERSVAYPHGHRNSLLAQRGVMTLPRLAPLPGPKPEGGVHNDDTKMFYRYLREFDGITAVHTSATSMGTDWRDHDPVVEPIVEIYQGDRMSYEIEGAPRSGYDPQLNKFPANIAGWFPKGFVNLALQKGYKLGFQASSDHWSTHISYFIILAEGNDRRSILDAVKKRRCYGATDAILVDFRIGSALMGEEIKRMGAPTLDIDVRGTAPIKKIDILRDSEVVHTSSPNDPHFQTRWTDPQPRPGTHYYYIRVLQADDEIAWSSPIWVH